MRYRPPAEEILQELKKLEEEGLGTVKFITKTQTVYYKPIPSDYNEDVLMVIATEEWDAYIAHFKDVDVTYMIASQHNRFLLKSDDEDVLNSFGLSLVKVTNNSPIAIFKSLIVLPCMNNNYYTCSRLSNDLLSYCHCHYFNSTVGPTVLAVMQSKCLTVLVSYCLTVLLSCYLSVSLSRTCCPTVLATALLSYSTVLLFHCLDVLLSHCPTVLLSYCLTVSLS